ncbi:hypothetical protein A2U01_0004994 [Trifolium medium]|uniref:Transmembrane protein n=1 Tax=Trifolium medium TaxID=97028 RepID=A0A392MAI6_9FABA|nr:hypothetical protein [Trifolium medium]
MAKTVALLLLLLLQLSISFTAFAEELQTQIHPPTMSPAPSHVPPPNPSSTPAPANSPSVITIVFYLLLLLLMSVPPVNLLIQKLLVPRHTPIAHPCSRSQTMAIVRSAPFHGSFMPPQAFSYSIYAGGGVNNLFRATPIRAIANR